jgi:hypothetical protein
MTRTALFAGRYRATIAGLALTAICACDTTAQSGARSAEPTSTAGTGGLAAGPDGAEVLFETFPGTLESMLVTDEAVYFSGTAGGTGIKRIPKTGGPPEIVGPWSGQGSSSLFATDDAYVYWLYRDHLDRVPRQGPPDVVEFPLGKEWRTVSSDDQGIYVATVGCTEIGFLSADHSNVEVVAVPNSEDVGGSTVLISDVATVYCLRLHGIHSVDKGTHAVTLLYETESDLYDMVQDAGALYFFDSGVSGSDPERFFRLDKQTEVTTESASFPPAGTGGKLHLDQPRNILYWRSGPSFDGELRTISLETRQNKVILRRPFARCMAWDEAYLYWCEEEPHPGSTAGLLDARVLRWKKPTAL